MPEPLVIALVLSAAIMHASWNALVKHSGERLLSLAVVVGTAGLVYVPVLPLVAPPAPASVPYFVASSTIHLGYYACLLLAYRVGDLGQVYPIARGTGPLIVALLSGAVAGEHLSATAAIGVGLVSLGIASLALGRHGSGKAAWFALATGVFIAGYTLSDGVGVRVAGSRIGYIAALHVCAGLPFAGVVLLLRRDRIRAFWPAHGRRAALGGVISAAAYSLVIFAMSVTRLSYVASLRETSVIIAALIGAIKLGEPFGRRRVLASAVVAAGIVLMSLSP